MLKDIDLQLLFAESSPVSTVARHQSPAEFIEELRRFEQFGTRTIESRTDLPAGGNVPVFTNEFWTAAQRDADNLHEVSYRACFKPQLPRFFIERLTSPGEVVYDPFMGRGTTLLEAAFLDRVPFGNDINPLSRILIKPRLCPPPLREIGERLKTIPWDRAVETWDELLVFYHPETLKQITALKAYLLEREKAGSIDLVDEWIRMVAVNRLTGHSAGFFSVYTLPPNQAVSIKSQIKINAKRNQAPTFRDVPALIFRKSRNLLKDTSAERLRRMEAVFRESLLVNCPASATDPIPDQSVSLVVTSPPFLDIVQYAVDNWLRCWFIGIDAAEVKLTVPAKLEDWQEEMTKVFRELDRVLRPGGHIAFEVGEVRHGKIRLEETVLACGTEAGLQPELVLINAQEFTKTANCWGVDNNAKGTNTNRIVLFRKATGLS